MANMLGLGQGGGMQRIKIEFHTLNYGGPIQTICAMPVATAITVQKSTMFSA